MQSMPSSMNIWNDGSVVSMRNQCSGKFLQVTPGKSINVDGREGNNTLWRVHRTNGMNMPAHVRLESMAYTGEYLNITDLGEICLKTTHCDFKAEQHGDMFILEPVLKPKMYLGGNSDGTIRLPKDTVIGENTRFIVRRAN